MGFNILFNFFSCSEIEQIYNKNYLNSSKTINDFLKEIGLSSKSITFLESDPIGGTKEKHAFFQACCQAQKEKKIHLS